LTLEIAGIAGFLQDTLGSKLTAYIAGVSDPKMVTKWAGGQSKPGAERERRLRAAYQELTRRCARRARRRRLLDHRRRHAGHPPSHTAAIRELIHLPHLRKR